MGEFYHLDSYTGSVEVRLWKIANYILNGTILVNHNRNYLIKEVEAYLHSDDHPDPFVHKDPHQLSSGCWYFHRQNEKAYKGGTFKGLDITFGYKDDENCYGGFLIRSLYCLTTQQLIQGPSNCVDDLCRNKGIVRLVYHLRKQTEEKPPIPVNLGSHLQLVPVENKRTQKMHASPRVGLTLKRGTYQDKAQYLMRPYRFTVDSDKIKKNKSMIFIGGLVANNNLFDLVKELRVGTSVAKKWERTFLSGKAMAKKVGYDRMTRQYVGKTLSMSDYLKLYGAYVHYCETR